MLKRTEQLSKLPKKREDNKETKMSKSHVFVKQVFFLFFFFSCLFSFFLFFSCLFFFLSFFFFFLFYGESPRTPPLEGTSLHRRNISVERPWGILSLFTTSLPLWVKSSRQSRCRMSPTQEFIACILRR